MEIGDEDAPFVTEPVQDPFEVEEPQPAVEPVEPVKRPERKPEPARVPERVPA